MTGEAKAQEIRDHYGISFEMKDPKGGDEYEAPYVEIEVLFIPKEKRGQGIATDVMFDLIRWADSNGYILALDPSSDFGSSVARLRKFYGQFGFVGNKGRNKDFRTRYAMIRQPKKKVDKQMKELNQLVENFFQPKRDTLGLDQLVEMVEQVMDEETMSGQANERNLVNAVKAVVAANDGPVELDLGSLGKKKIVDAEQLGGGNPEPKADIKLITSTGKEIGISMKKENFAFLENWMDEKKLLLRLQQVGMEFEEAEKVVEEIKEELKTLTSDMKQDIEKERKAFVSIAEKADPDYEFPNPINRKILEALLESKEFGDGKGKFKTSFKLKNYYRTLSELFGDKYSKFLEIIVKGDSDNPNQAEGVLVSNVPSEINSIEELQNITANIKSIDEVVDAYEKDPKINIRFRLRPMTKVRTTYSKTNRGKYKVGQRLFEDESLGISWTTSVVK
jgi:hypothetical protein